MGWEMIVWLVLSRDATESLLAPRSDVAAKSATAINAVPNSQTNLRSPGIAISNTPHCARGHDGRS
jgi:hypothetical protein